MLDHVAHVYRFQEFGKCVRHLKGDDDKKVQCSCLMAHIHRRPTHHFVRPTRLERSTLELRILEFDEKQDCCYWIVFVISEFRESRICIFS